MDLLRKPLNQINYLLASVVLIVINYLTLLAIQQIRDGASVNNVLLALAALLSALELTAFVIISGNRLRDAGLNRWFALLALIPFVGFPIAWLVLLLLPSHK
jgi:uncharacterized membrane protein YhaH (DUF805 family)